MQKNSKTIASVGGVAAMAVLSLFAVLSTPQASQSVRQSKSFLHPFTLGAGGSTSRPRTGEAVIRCHLKAERSELSVFRCLAMFCQNAKTPSNRTLGVKNFP